MGSRSVALKTIIALNYEKSKWKMSD